MTGTIGFAALTMLGFGALVLIGITTIHVSMRWWAMLMGGLDWDDAGALIRARYRRKHGLHHAGEKPQPQPQPVQHTPWQASTVRVLPASEITQVMPRVRASGRPPWESDDTHELPRVKPDAW